MPNAVEEKFAQFWTERTWEFAGCHLKNMWFPESSRAISWRLSSKVFSFLFRYTLQQFPQWRHSSKQTTETGKIYSIYGVDVAQYTPILHRFYCFCFCVYLNLSYSGHPPLVQTPLTNVLFGSVTIIITRSHIYAAHIQIGTHTHVCAIICFSCINRCAD